MKLKKSKLRKCLFLLIFFIFSMFVFRSYHDETTLDSYECSQFNNHKHRNSYYKARQIKVCMNNLSFNSEIAIWSLISDDTQNYVHGAIKLLKSIRNNVKHTKFDAILFELVEKPFELRFRETLKNIGWKICQVNRISPLISSEDTIPMRFRDQFTKLLLWNIDEYRANYWFDLDTLVIRGLDDFLSMYKVLEKNDSLKLACAQDFREKWVDSFNMGVFFVKPNKTEYQRLLRIKNDPNFKFETIMAEQGFLNEIYKNQWYNIGFKNNANSAVYESLKEYWLQNEREINVIHFTNSKPWDCSNKYKYLCDRWRMLNPC